MCASFKEYLRSGGRLTREVIVQLIDEHEQLTQVVRKLRRREAALVDELQAERLECETAVRRADELEAELDQLRQGLQEKRREERPGTPEQATAQTASAADRLAARYEKRIDSLLGDLKRLRARADAAAEQARDDEKVRMLGGMGQLLDALERAVQMSEGPWREGFEAIEAQFLKFLEEEGAQVIDETDRPMDPEIHRAVDQVERRDMSRGQIVEIRRRGLMLRDGAVIRPAEVVVAK